MQLPILAITLLVVFFVPPTRAASSAPPGSAASCVSADVNTIRANGDGQLLYRIVFLNHCDLPRSFFWCAEHPHMQLPATVACSAQRGMSVELRHAIRYRKEFQWHLPPGVRIRFQDCASQEIPTSDFGCAPLATTTLRR